MLDGECKIEFEKWYDEHEEYDIGRSGGHSGDFHPSREYGVKEDFFDSVDIVISIELHFVGDPRYDFDAGYRFEVCINEDDYSMYRTRQEARSAAITKANELFNLRRESK